MVAQVVPICVAFTFRSSKLSGSWKNNSFKKRVTVGVEIDLRQCNSRVPPSLSVQLRNNLSKEDSQVEISGTFFFSIVTHYVLQIFRICASFSLLTT